MWGILAHSKLYLTVRTGLPIQRMQSYLYVIMYHTANEITPVLYWFLVWQAYSFHQIPNPSAWMFQTCEPLHILTAMNIVMQNSDDEVDEITIVKGRKTKKSRLK